MKRCSLSLIVGEMQIKISIQCNFIPRRTVIAKNMQSNIDEAMEKLKSSYVADEDTRWHTNLKSSLTVF